MAHRVTTLPMVSIVIPAHNEATMLPHCLNSIKKQDFKGRYELIVVDNASSDETASIAEQYGATVIFEPTKGVAYARIAGFAAAKGEIIASTDADTIVPASWLSDLVKELEDRRYAGVVGSYMLCNVNTLPKKLIQFTIPLFRSCDWIMGAHFAGANFAVRKAAYQAVGGFDTNFQTGEDFDLSYRLRKAGFILKVAYDIQVRTSARRLNEGFWYTLVNYVFKNWGSLVFAHHPYLRVLSVVREDPNEIEDIARP